MKNFIPSPATFVRRACFEAVGPYDETLAYEDWDMWLRIARRYEFRFSSRVSACYRVVPTSLLHNLQERRADLEETWLRIALKHVGHSPEADELALQRAFAKAMHLYELDDPRHRRHLRTLARIDPGPGRVVAYGLAALRVPYPAARPIIERISRLGRRARGARGTHPTA